MSRSPEWPDLVICKWNPKPVRALLDAGRVVHLVLDGWDQKFGNVPGDVLDQVASVHVVDTFDSLPEVYGVAASLRDMGVSKPLVGSFAEFSQFGAGVLGDLLGAPNQSAELSLKTRDKRAMKSAYVAGGVPCARWLSVPDITQLPSEADVTDAVGWPVVVKPVSGISVMGTKRADNYDDLVAIASNIDLPPEVGCDQFMLEEYLEGTEFHVDAIWDDGDAWYLSVSQYPTTRLSIVPGEEGTIFLNEDENSDLYKHVRELHDRVNNAIGITSGATHFEFFQLKDGSLIASEVASRIGGGPVVDLIIGRDGFDIREMWAAQLGGLPRPEITPGSGSNHQHVAAISIPAQGSGVVTSLPQPEELEKDPHVISSTPLISVGEEVHGLWSMFLVLGAASREELDGVIAESRRRYRVLAEQ